MSNVLMTSRDTAVAIPSDSESYTSALAGGSVQ